MSCYICLTDVSIRSPPLPAFQKPSEVSDLVVALSGLEVVSPPAPQEGTQAAWQQTSS